jgi:hypothetical protein
MPTLSKWFFDSPSASWDLRLRYALCNNVIANVNFDIFWQSVPEVCFVGFCNVVDCVFLCHYCAMENDLLVAPVFCYPPVSVQITFHFLAVALIIAFCHLMPFVLFFLISVLGKNTTNKESSMWVCHNRRFYSNYTNRHTELYSVGKLLCTSTGVVQKVLYPSCQKG